MKVLLATLEYPPFFGGIARYYANMAGVWPEINGLAVLDNNHNKLVSKFLYPHWLPSIWNLWYHIKKENADYILVGQILPLGIAMYIISFFNGKKYGIFLHGMDIVWTLKSGRKKFIAGKILARAENIICSSRFAPEIVKKNFPDVDVKKIHIVNPGVEARPLINKGLIKKLRSKHQLEGKIVLLTLARLVKRKGQDLTIKALRQLEGKVSNLIYVIAGTGPDENYLYEIAAGLPNVIFTGQVTEEEKWTWFDLCDLFIMPSRNIAGDVEGFGIVYLEANLAGKPVIAGRSGGVEEAVIDNYNGLLVDPEDENAITAAIIKLAADNNLCNKLGEQGRIRAEKDFSWPEQSKKIFNIIHKL